MSSRKREIEEFLSTEKAAAPDITNTLKSIGDDNMLDGVRRIYEYGHDEGEKQGIIEGIFIAVVFGLSLFIFAKAVGFAKRKTVLAKEHKENEEKIITAFQENLVEEQHKGGSEQTKTLPILEPETCISTEKEE